MESTSCWTPVFVILIIIICILSYCNTEEQFREHFGSECIDFIPFKSQVTYPLKSDKIFVSIASYRDDECQETIRSIYDKASNPNDIYIGICQQNKESSEKCDLGIPEKYKSNIRQIDMDFMKAKGPTYARYWCSTLWEGEEFFLQIDSHTHFVNNWDEDLIKMFRQCQEESSKPVLSVYPPTEKQMTIDGAPEMCNGKLTKDNIPVFLAGWTGKSNKPKRSPKPFTAGGFMFLQGDFLYDIPYDPNLSHLFQGEETLFSARLFTWGYDFYTPNIKVAWHHYTRDGKPKYWSDHSQSTECRRKAEKRVLFMLGLGEKKNVATDFLRDIHNYGFGRVRTLDNYWKTAGIDFDKTEQDALCDDCNDKYNKDSKYEGWNFKKDGYKNIIKI